MFRDLFILIPGHCLEDIPSDASESDAEGLLNAFAVAWHPVLLANTETLPEPRSSEDIPDDLHRRMIFVPAMTEDWLPHEWVADARDEGAFVISSLRTREELVEAVLQTIAADRGNEADGMLSVDDDLVADFMALGVCHLQMEQLSRHMHHYYDADDEPLRQSAVGAAEAACRGNADEAQRLLKVCFEHLTETRERFYPVECWLIDLCLMSPDLANDVSTAPPKQPLNYLITASDVDRLAESSSEVVDAWKRDWQAARIDFAGGDLNEEAVPLIPLEAMLADLNCGLEVFKRRLGQTPTTWARRRFGFSTLLPQVLSQLGFHSALHIALDDGIYPENENAKVMWEGCDGTTIDALCRIPLPGDSASGFLRFAERLAESMEQDMVAAVSFARWPKLTTPWLDDLHRMAKYSPALGSFVTLDRFGEEADAAGRSIRPYDREYLSPFLIQFVVRGEADSVSRFSRFAMLHRRNEAAMWCESTARVIFGQSAIETSDDAYAQAIRDAGPDGSKEAFDRAHAEVENRLNRAARRLADVITSGGEEADGYLLLNPLPFERSIVSSKPHANSGNDSQNSLFAVSVPGCGYKWVSAESSAPQASDPPLVDAENLLLRSRTFEVQINGDTGGIARIKNYGRSPNRLSQQIAQRYERERTVTGEDGDYKTSYSEMRCADSRIVDSSSETAAIETRGAIVDPQTHDALAQFRQRVRVFRSRPFVEVEIEFTEVAQIPDGNPWTGYICSRFAWHDPAASLTRSVYGQAQGIGVERFETLDYLEIVSDDQRTTIIPHGLPFHRKTGMRMADSVLLVAGETQRSFRFTIAIDQNYPMQASVDACSPPLIVPVSRRPKSATSGWLFHIDSKNVWLSRILNAFPATGKPEMDDSGEESSAFAIRLVETEGRAANAWLQCFRPVKRARKVDLQGNLRDQLECSDGAVKIPMYGYEIANVEVFV